MALHARVKRHEHPLLPIRREVRKPIVLFAKRDLLLFATIRAHPPDLHVPGAFGVEVNVFAVGRVFRPIIQSLGGSKSRLLAAGSWNRVDIEIAIPLADEPPCFPFRRPTFPLPTSFSRDP